MSPPPGRLAAVTAVLLAVAAAQTAVGLSWLPSHASDPAAWEVWLTGGFYAVPRPFLSPWLLVALACGLAAAAGQRLPALLLLGGAMHLALALSGPAGWRELTGPLLRPEEFLSDFPRLSEQGPLGYLGTYVERQRSLELPLHAQTHPPGPVYLLSFLVLIAGHPLPLALYLIGLTCAGALLLVRLARGFVPPETAVTAAALWLVMPSVALFDGTTLDVARAAAGVVAALGYAAAGRRDTGAAWFLAGALHAALTLFSFGLLALIPVFAGLFWPLRPARLGAAILGALSFYLLLWLATGFDAWACLLTVRRNTAEMLATLGRPAAMVLLHAPVFAASSGLALTAALLVGPRPPWVTRLLLGVAAAMLLTSGVARGEVERVWLPFTPFLALAAAGMLDRPLARIVGAALVVQAVAVQALFSTFW